MKIALYVPGGTSSSTMNKCPDKSVFDIDLRSVVRGDLHTTFGIQVTEPLITNPIVLNPLDFSMHTGGVFGTGFLGSTTCSLGFNIINYSSPIYAVSSFNGRSFAIQTIYTTAGKPSPATQNDLSVFLAGAGAVAGVPASVAASYLNEIKNGLGNAQVINTVSVTQNPAITIGAIQGVLTWVVPGAIKKTDATPAFDVILVAQIVPVGDLISEPGTGWTPSDVLGTAFNYANAPAGTNPTLGSYIDATYSASLQQYVAAATDALADNDCAALRIQMQNAQLSDHDRILTTWAVTKKRLATAGATDATIDNLKCMNDDWSKLVALGVARTQPPPPMPPSPPSPSAAGLATPVLLNPINSQKIGAYIVRKGADRAGTNSDTTDDTAVLGMLGPAIVWTGSANPMTAADARAKLATLVATNYHCNFRIPVDDPASEASGVTMFLRSDGQPDKILALTGLVGADEDAPAAFITYRDPTLAEVKACTSYENKRSGTPPVVSK